MTCPNCGLSNAVSAKFCANCGTSLEAAGPQSPSSPPPSSFQEPPQYQSPGPYQQPGPYQPPAPVSTGTSLGKNIALGCLIAALIFIFMGLSCTRACLRLGRRSYIQHRY